MGRVGCRTEWTFCHTKPGTYTWGVQTINAAYEGSTFTEGPQFTVAEDDISDAIFEIKDEKLKMKNEGAVYDLSGRQINARSSTLHSLLKKGIYIMDKRKVLY
jgi:hypothetical protein